MHSHRKAQPAARFESPAQVQVTKLEFVWRALAFTVLELSFLALATHCLTKPIPLFSNIISSMSLLEAKAITTAIAVAWHTAALFPIRGIISIVCSAECIAQYRRTGHLQPNTTDRVSCITSGLLAQTTHFLTLQPTLEYRLVFLLILSTMVLVPLGPSTIGLSQSGITRQGSLQIANLTMTKGFLSNPQHQCFAKADEIVNLEFVEGGTYGYETQTKEMLIPWPEPGFEASQSIIQYESDVVVYNYTCRWPKFTFNKAQVIITELANVSWTPWNTMETSYGGGIHVILPLSNPEDKPLPISAFIFIDDPNKPYSNIGLGSIASSVNVTKKDMKGANKTTTFDEGAEAAILLCDPQYLIQRAQVTLQDGQLSTTALPKLPPLGNFPESAANSLFSQAFLDAFAPGDIDVFSMPAMLAFMADHGSRQIVLTLPEISQNMNMVIQSAAKAYVSGYTGTDGSQLGLFPSYTSFNQSVTILDQRLSLVSSRTFLVALWGLNAVIILILVVLLYTTKVEEMWPFSLRTMETIYRDLPKGDDDLPTSLHPQSNLYTNKLGFAWRLIAFVILESGFLAFSRSCFTNPIPVYLPSAISPSQAKSATTVVAVTWRTLAIFPIRDIISSVFSAECVAQYHRTGHLEPNNTDRVSRATSGVAEQVPHFLTRQPTLEFRLAFLLAILVLVIGPLGPGVISLTESLMTSSQGLQVANMTMNQGFALVDQRQISPRAKTFIELELLEGRVYGYDTVTEGVLIPWPESGLERSQNITVYESDVVVYNYSCRWPGTFSTIMPQESSFFEFGVVIPGVLPNGTRWFAWGDEPQNQSLHEEAIFQLIRDRDRGIPLLSANSSARFDTSSKSPLSAFIFSGNSTFLDLENTGSVRITSEGSPNTTMSLSILLCDPQYKIQRANVTLTGGNLSANVLPGFPPIGNFPETSANALFSQALLDTVGPEDEDSDRLLSPMSMLLFTGGFNGTKPLHPLSLSVINSNMNRVLKSAAKAYLSGYNSSVDSTVPSYSLWNQTATVQYQQLALVGSKTFFILLLVFAALTAIVLMVLFSVIDIGKMQLFNLQTLEKVYIDELTAKDSDE